MEKEKEQQKDGTKQPANTEVELLRHKLKIARLENRLAVELAGSGAEDIETACLVAKERMKTAGTTDVKEVVRAIREDKPFLFKATNTAAGRTQPVKIDERQKSRLAKAAAKAAKNASRQNVFEYMKARRGWEVEVKR